MTGPGLHGLIILLVIMIVAGTLLSILTAVATRRMSDVMARAPARIRPKLSPQASATVMVVGAIWYALDSWLEYKTGWPARYGLNCFGRCDLTDRLSHSFALLHRGPNELALFLMLWAGPLGIFLCGLWVLRKYLTGEDTLNSDDTDKT